MEVREGELTTKGTKKEKETQLKIALVFVSKETQETVMMGRSHDRLSRKMTALC